MTFTKLFGRKSQSSEATHALSLPPLRNELYAALTTIVRSDDFPFSLARALIATSLRLV